MHAGFGLVRGFEVGDRSFRFGGHGVLLLDLRLSNVSNHNRLGAHSID